MLVRDAMSTGATTIDLNQFLTTAAGLMKDNRIGCLPVVDYVIRGILTDRDLLRAVAEGHEMNRTRVYQVMTAVTADTSITSCFEDETVDDVIRRMDSNEIHHIPVLRRRDNHIVGMLTMSDLAHRGPGAGALTHHVSRDARRRPQGTS